MSYILFSYPDCASHVVRMALEELGASYRDETVDMRAGHHHSDEFRRLNPRGMVPVLADEATGATLSETGAILTYLAEQNGRLAPPVTDPEARALFLLGGVSAFVMPQGKAETRWLKISREAFNRL